MAVRTRGEAHHVQGPISRWVSAADAQLLAATAETCATVADLAAWADGIPGHAFSLFYPYRFCADGYDINAQVDDELRARAVGAAIVGVAADRRSSAIGSARVRFCCAQCAGPLTASEDFYCRDHEAASDAELKELLAT